MTTPSAASTALTEPVAHPVVLFDGVCNLCNASVQFIVDRDPQGLFRFTSLQSDRGAELLRAHGRPVPVHVPGAPPPGPDSVILIEDGKVYERSTAALRIARRLSGLWWMLAIFLVVPSVVRDLVYKWIARNRYRWFGKSEQCRIPTPELRTRFLK